MALGFKARACAALCASLILASCGSVPTDGPLTREVLQSAKSSAAPNSLVYEVVDVDLRVANLVSAYVPISFERTFGFGGPATTPVIGVGDALSITIFEAGPDGLFSTKEQKSITLNVVVQPDGRAPIPYVGSFKFAGNTLEAARRSIVSALTGKAVEPDVVIALAENASRTVSINGAIGRPSIVPLGLSGEQLTEIIAKAGGPTKAPYDSYVSLTRGNKTGNVLLQTLVEKPKENVYAKPGDQIFVTFDPRTFTVLGSTGKVGQIPFNAASLTLIEAAALAGGSNVNLADPKGYFVFRYEDENIVKLVLGDKRFNEKIANGMYPNRAGRYPIIYRINMSNPQSYMLGQNFPVNNKDVIYLSRHPATDFIKFLNLVAAPAGLARTVNGF
ncbi:polysaccharide export outer membrane protein [Phyllobacterium trifolii]|uniref:Polysaccharide export outer membrane protein n=1 Tax=Phyllobacterium trifolii TaxID=300193 RepID=A0A839UM38_9HYPH|nr:polysaccharide biosynthesis/export family protein [Phyllobacterium trifolii]MBB3149752.1 polysaccharide export outer membrane protein [Phyllobacterium trifolii]